LDDLDANMPSSNWKEDACGVLYIDQEQDEHNAIARYSKFCLSVLNCRQIMAIHSIQRWVRGALSKSLKMFELLESQEMNW
jgi:hypothetical protein